MRLVFPTPQVLDFHRRRYVGNVGDPVDPSTYRAHRTLWWWSAPDHASFTRRLNLYGFRGKTWRLQKAPGWHRVALVGDSFVEGLGTPDDDTISERLAALAAADGIKVEALNLGIGGTGLSNYARLLVDAVPLFQPDEVILIVYANDLYRIPTTEGLLTPTVQPRLSTPWQPRALGILANLRRGEPVPRRWHFPATRRPTPLDVAARFESEPQLLANIERFAEPGLAAAMKAGRLNPSMVNLLARSEFLLALEVDPEAYLRSVAGLVAKAGAGFRVAFIPSLNQVSDAYLPVQRKLSRPMTAASLTGSRFQIHAHSLTRACERASIPFLDLTPAIARAESAGTRLYWPHDAHMNAAGYRLVARELYDWRRVVMAGASPSTRQAEDAR